MQSLDDILAENDVLRGKIASIEAKLAENAPAKEPTPPAQHEQPVVELSKLTLTQRCLVARGHSATEAIAMTAPQPAPAFTPKAGSWTEKAMVAQGYKPAPKP